MEQNAALFQKNRKPHSLIKVIVGRSNIYNFKIYLKERKKNIKFPLEQKKKKKKNEKQKQTNKQTNKKELNECVYNFSVDYRTFDNVLKECLSDY